MKKVRVSIVIPAYNEELNIKKGSLEDVWEYLKKQRYTWEVVVVDDGSKDKTAKAVEGFAKYHQGFRLLKEPHRGKGGTVIAGMLNARGEIILFTDMDQATPIKELAKLLPYFNKDYAIVIGSRAGREGAPILRKLMAYGFAMLRTVILRLPYKDTQCGFKAFKKEAANKIFERMKIFSEKMKSDKAGVTAGFDLELLYIARKLGLRVKEVPVEWHHKGTERVNPVKDSWEGFRDLMKVRINALRGVYRL